VGVQHGDGAVAWVAPTGAAAYPRPLLTVLFSRADRRIANMMLSRARRPWPLLRLVPRTRARQLLLPTATLARQDLARVVVLGAILAEAALLLIPGVMLQAEPDRLRVES
jgi:hypothetical protein